MTFDGHMGSTKLRWATLVGRAALLVLAAVAVDLAQSESTTSPSSPAVTLCDKCDPDRSPRADQDLSQAGRHDDLDDRPIQLETMNQQLRMEKRRGDSLLHLYPDEAAHNAARLHDLEKTEKPIRDAEERVENLARERRRLREATALYAGKPLPSQLREQARRVDVALQLARATLKDCREEREFVGQTYDEELVVLRRLWAAQGRT